MALDGVFLSTIAHELKEQLINSKIDKVNQPEKDELIITIRGKKALKLLISANSKYPRIHFTEASKQNPIQPPMFCMVLRKYLTNGRIRDLYQVNNDRILCLEITSKDELGFDSVYKLIVEIMGRHSNVTLVRDRDQKIMDSVKHITAEVNSYRTLLPGTTFKFPPSSLKLNPFDYTLNQLKSIIKENDILINENFYFNCFTGISKTLSKSLFLSCSANTDLTLEKLNSAIKEYILKLSNHDYDFNIFYNDKEAVDFYCSPLEIYSKYKRVSFESSSKLLDTFYYEKDKLDRLKSRSHDLDKLIQTNLERCNKKISILTSIIEESKEKDTLKIYGELLTANIYAIKPGSKKIKLLNYYSQEEEYLEIPLDENLTPSQNIQKYYKKYNKLKKSEISAIEQLNSTQEEIEYLTSVANNIDNIESYEEINDIRDELTEAGYIKFKKGKKKDIKTKPHHFISSQGYDIYVGKNNLQNDYLTLKFASKNDLWLHTKNIPGSHVIIKGTNIPLETIIEAAALAANYSKAKNSSKVPVDYTEVKNVKKPNGAKPGMVIYNTNKTIMVDPSIAKNLDK